MVAPTPNLNLSVDLDDLPKNVREIHKQIGIPGTPGTIADNVKVTRDQLTTIATDTSNAASQATTAAASSARLEKAIGSPSKRPIADIVEATNNAVGTLDDGTTVAGAVQATRGTLQTVDFATTFPKLCLDADKAARDVAQNDAIADVRKDIAALRSLVWFLWLVDHRWSSHRRYTEITAEQLLQACEPNVREDLPSQDQIGSWMRTARTSAATRRRPRTPANRSRKRRTA
jgi:hypothetical protein